MVMAMWMARVILKCWGDTITYYIPQLKRRKTSLKNNEKHVLPTGWSHCSLHWGCPTVLCTWNKTRIISRKCEFSWPPYSPDLNPCDLFLWGHLKELLYRDPAAIQYTTVEELNDSIRREIRKLNRNTDMFMAVFDNFLVHGACVKLLNCTIIEYILEILNCIERYT